MTEAVKTVNVASAVSDERGVLLLPTPVRQEKYRHIQKWLDTRPFTIRAMAKKYPVATGLVTTKGRYVLVGYQEPHFLLFAPEGLVYKEMMKQKFKVCIDHLEEIPWEKKTRRN